MTIRLTDTSLTMESDRFYKSITPDDFVGTDGDVDAPTGWFGLVVIDDSFRATWDGDQIPASVHNGTYLVTVDSNGLVWAEQSIDHVHTYMAYAAKCAEYGTWARDDDAECTDPGCQTCGDRRADDDTED